MLVCRIKYLIKVGNLKCWKLLNRFKNDQGADLKDGKGVDGNSGADGISKVGVAMDFLFKLIQVSWVPAPSGRSADMLYRYLWHGGEKSKYMILWQIVSRLSRQWKILSSHCGSTKLQIQKIFTQDNELTLQFKDKTKSRADCSKGDGWKWTF